MNINHYLSQPIDNAYWLTFTDITLYWPVVNILVFTSRCTLIICVFTYINVLTVFSLFSCYQFNSFEYYNFVIFPENYFFILYKVSLKHKLAAILAKTNKIKRNTMQWKYKVNINLYKVKRNKNSNLTTKNKQKCVNITLNSELKSRKMFETSNAVGSSSAYEKSKIL